MWIRRALYDIRTTLHEDSTGCITRARARQHTTRSKFYWLKSALVPLFLHEDDDGTDGPIVIRKIDTKVQLADILPRHYRKWTSNVSKASWDGKSLTSLGELYIELFLAQSHFHLRSRDRIEIQLSLDVEIPDSDQEFNHRYFTSATI
jgi:hypothetical protein